MKIASDSMILIQPESEKHSATPPPSTRPLPMVKIQTKIVTTEYILLFLFLFSVNRHHTFYDSIVLKVVGCMHGS